MQYEPYALDTRAPCVCLKDKYGRYLYLNRTLEILHNVSPGEMIGKTDFHWQNDNVAQRLRENDRQVLATKNPLITLETATIAGGELSYWIVEKFPAPCVNGVLLACIGIHVGDIVRVYGEQKGYESGLERLQTLKVLRHEVLDLARYCVEAHELT